MIYSCPTPVGNGIMDAVLLAPPLIISDAEVDELAEKLDAALGAVERDARDRRAGPGPGPEELRAAPAQGRRLGRRLCSRAGVAAGAGAGRAGPDAAALPAHPPRTGEPLEAMMDDVDRVILPGITHWNHPGFFAYFGITGSPPGILGELISAALNVNAMLWRTSPAATELEQRDAALGCASCSACREGWFGQITDTASISTLYALAAAREAAGLDVRKRGHGRAGRSAARCASTPRPRRTRRSRRRASRSAWARARASRSRPTTSSAMRADLLREAIAADCAAGVRPIAVVATVGTTSTTSIDPVPDDRRHLRRARHVAARGRRLRRRRSGACPRMRHLLDGCERADSLVVNPHKWLLTPIDCSLLYTAPARRPARRRSRVVPDYLTTERRATSST